MTKIENKQQRKLLDEALANTEDTLLVLSGSDATAAKALHEAATDNITEPWRKTFWIADLKVLSTKELEDDNVKLFARGGRFALLGWCTDKEGDQHRVVVRRGYHSELLDSGGEPDLLKLRSAFRDGAKSRSC